DTTEQQYLDVIYGKTAMLFEASTWGMASLLGRSEAEREALCIYGRELGLAFQLIDDVLDYEGDAAAMGKNVGDDLAEGRPTLPQIHAMTTGNDEQHKGIRAAIRRGGRENMKQL